MFKFRRNRDLEIGIERLRSEMNRLEDRHFKLVEKYNALLKHLDLTVAKTSSEYVVTKIQRQNKDEQSEAY